MQWVKKLKPLSRNSVVILSPHITPSEVAWIHNYIRGFRKKGHPLTLVDDTGAGAGILGAGIILYHLWCIHYVILLCPRKMHLRASNNMVYPSLKPLSTAPCKEKAFNQKVRTQCTHTCACTNTSLTHTNLILVWKIKKIPFSPGYVNKKCLSPKSCFKGARKLQLCKSLSRSTCYLPYFLNT